VRSPKIRVISNISILFGLFATISTPFLAAHGYDSLVRHDLGAAADLAPFATATTADGGLWLLARGNSNQHQLVRLDANGNRTAGLFLPTAVDSDNSDRFTLHPLADGGVLELDTQRRSQFETACILRSITRQGVLRFERNVRQSSCSVQVGRLGRAPYLLTNTSGATVISEDGSLASSFVPANGSSLIRADFVAEQEALLLRTNEMRTGYMLSRANYDGSLRWSNPLENVRFNQNVTVRGLNDGRALVLISDVSKLQMRFYSAAGSVLETREIAMPEAAQASFGDWSADAQGNLALALRFEVEFSSENYGAILFAANATVLKQVRYAPTDRCAQRCPLLGLTQGFANALKTQTGAKLVITSLLPNVANKEVVLDGNFSARIANSSNATILLTSTSTFRAFNTNGVEIATPPMVGKRLTAPQVLAAAIAEDGKSFVLQEVFEGDYINQLQAFAANGTKLWQRSISNARNIQLVANATRVCIKGENDVATITSLTCFNSNNGVELVSTVLANQELRGVRMRFLADGRLRVAHPLPFNGLKIVDVSNDNQVSQLTAVTNSVQAIVDIGASGSLLLKLEVPTSSTTVEWLALLANGQLAFRHATTASGFSEAFSGRMLENDDVLLITPNQTAQSVNFDTTLLNPSGVQRWRVSNSRISEFDYLGNIFLDSKNAYLLRRADGTLRLQALSLNDGRSVWQQTLKGGATSTVAIFASPNTNELLVSVESKFGVQLSGISSTDGALVQQRLLDCAATDCIVRATTLDNTGNFRSVSEAQDAGPVAITLGRVDARANAPEIGLAQIGLSGAWYTPQISGQGLFFEYFPQNKLLFAPWFTFSVPNVSSSGAPLDSDNVADLRWYSLSGIIEPGAKVAQLEIRRNIAGVFNSAPITESTVVGSATLRAQDCNRATLEFEFISSEAQGKYGVLPLDRLTGGSAPCLLSNGQVLPGRDARPARGGFDGRQSGSWFQPQTAGQGLMMTVQPATATAPGFFFGGWFTYDAGTPNDPTSQHWLTLSGEIPVNAQVGVVPVTIYRTLGGQLAAVPTQNNAILGQGTVTFSGCANAVLRYQFDDTLIAGTFRARAGVINLERLGACPAQ
jgi:outer membrane protein assembly factor BamB